MGTTSTYKSGEEHGLTDKQLAFCEEYLTDSNGTRAAIAAGYSPTSATTKASALLRLPKVVRYIGKIRKELRSSRQIERNEILEQLWFCATRDAADYVDENGKIPSNIRMLPERARATIDSIEQIVCVDPISGEEKIHTKFKFTPKLQAIDMAMRHKGLFDTTDTGAIVSECDWDNLLERSEVEDEIDAEIRMRIEHALDNETVDAEVISSEILPKTPQNEDKEV